MHTNNFVYCCTNQYMYIFTNTSVQILAVSDDVVLHRVLSLSTKFNDCFFGVQLFLEDCCTPMMFRLCLLHAEETPRTLVAGLYNLLVIGWIRHVFEPRDVDCQLQYGRLVVHHHI